MAGISLYKIQRQGFPRVDLESMRITTVYPGASPEDVELNVTIPLEEALKGVVGLKEYTSRSMENMSIVHVKIDSDVDDAEKVKDEIRRAIDGVTDLPEDIKERPLVFEEKFDNFEIYDVVLTMPGKNDQVLNRHARELKRRLLDIDEVSKIYDSGILDREIHILLNKKKMAQNMVSFEEVIQSIKQNKLRISGGSIESFTSRKNIVTLSEFERAKDIEKIIIRSNFSGFRLRIGDIARVVDTFEDEDSYVRFNGQRGASFWIAKKGKADIITTVDKIKKEVEEYRKENGGEGIEIFSTFDASIETKNRLSIVSGNAIAGFVLVLLVLFLFLDNRTAFWTAVGIPISVGLTIIAMPFFDITVNSISLCGMVVVLGMIVDDAIIISESVSRAKERGMDPPEAALHGLKTVIKPVFGTIVTTMIAFIPLYFIPGMIGKFAVEIPSIVILMLTASFIEASIILPAHLAHEKGGPEIKQKDTVPPGQKLISFLEKGYVKILERGLRFKYRTLLFFLLFLLGGAVFSYFTVRFNMFPVDQATKLWIYGETKKDSTLEHNARESAKVEKLLKGLPSGIVHSYKTHVGWDPNNFEGFIKSTNHFVTFVQLTPATERTMTIIDVKKFLQGEFGKNSKKIGIDKLNFFIDSGGPPVGKPLEIKIWGNDNKIRHGIVEKIMKDLEVMEVKEVDSDYRAGKPELRLLPNYELIAGADVSVAAIASTVRTAFDGTIVTHMQKADEKVPFRVMLDKEKLDYQKPLEGLLVRNRYGNLVDLTSLVKVSYDKSPQNIFHYNSYRTNTITGNIDLEKTTPSEVYDRLLEKYKNFNSEYPGFNLQLGGEAQESVKTIRQMTFALIAAVVAIYFLLVIQFNSFYQPFMVILSVPFGVAGLLIAFGLHGMDLSMLALTGVLGFAGVAVNDSLIMVDFINRLKRFGSVDKGEDDVKNDGGADIDFTEAVIEGARLRFRPILLTTVTTVAGLVPTAYGIIGGIDSFISPMVMAMTWGLFFGTASVLIVIPVFYSVNNDIALKLKSLFKEKPV